MSDYIKYYKKLQKYVPLTPTSYCLYIFLNFEFSRRIKNFDYCNINYISTEISGEF